jgi:hypothetical protein
MHLYVALHEEKHSSILINRRRLILSARFNLWFYASLDLKTKQRPARNDGNEMTVSDNLSFPSSILV